MALQYISSDIRDIKVIDFVKECIAKVWLPFMDSSKITVSNYAVITTNDSPLTVMGGIPLIYDETDQKYKLYINVGINCLSSYSTHKGNLRYWYDIDAGFSMLTYNHYYGLLRFYTDVESSTIGIKYWLTHLVTKIDGVSYLLPGEQNAGRNDYASGNMILPPFSCVTSTRVLYASVNVPYLSTSFSTTGNDITLVPLCIGACIIPDMYVSVNNYALTDQIITDGINNYICLDSFLFRKIT